MPTAPLAYPGPGVMKTRNCFQRFQKVLAKHPHAKEFTSLDGNCFFKTALENHNLWDKPKGTAADTEELRKKLTEKLADLNTAPPSPFYAMLLMDGDRLGALLQKHPAKTELISGALNKFSLKVPFVIETENGITVFAGGGRCAGLVAFGKCHGCCNITSPCLFGIIYRRNSQATISGAIVYAHFTTPLTEVYHEAQRLLTEVAKDKPAGTVWPLPSGKVQARCSPGLPPGNSFLIKNAKLISLKILNKVYKKKLRMKGSKLNSVIVFSTIFRAV
jgi:CRISPR-associated protein Cmr2